MSTARVADLGSEEVREPRFKLVRFRDVTLSTERRYLIKDLIPRAGLTVVWGPPKSGKSFWMFDAAMHIACGWEYRGRRVQQGGVVYVAAEGSYGFKARIEAFRQRHLSPNDDPPLFMIAEQPRFGADRAASDDVELIHCIRAATGSRDGPALVVLDTLNRTLNGSESSDEDMGGYVRAADAIAAAFSCAVAVVHHCGIEGTRPRGHTSLTGAADAQLKVARAVGSEAFTVTVEFMKDGEEGDKLASRLERVDVGVNEDGDEITSCVVVEVDASVAPARRKLSPRNELAMDALRSLLIDHGRPAPDAVHYPPGTRVVAKSAWRDVLFMRGVLDRAAANPRSDYIRVKKKLLELGAIAQWGDDVWPAGGA
jgi:hypothetical protein